MCELFFINWTLAVPLLMIFSWPYFFLGELFGINKMLSLPGSMLFGLPFMFTILHGHVTMALGAAHRHHYYAWLTHYSLTYGLFFYSIVTSTRFRLILFFSSIVVLVIGYLLR